MIQDSSLRAVLASFDANNKMEMLITTITAAEEKGKKALKWERDGMEWNQSQDHTKIFVRF